MLPLKGRQLIERARAKPQQQERMRRRFRDLRPMSAFNPEMRAFIHDERSNRMLEWKPEWASHYREWAFLHPNGKIEWRGLFLDGWRPSAIASPMATRSSMV
jgi:hypothetical protein